MDAERGPLGRLTWARFARAAASLATSNLGRAEKRLFGALVLLMFGINGMNVVNSYVGRDFMTAIEQRDLDEFWMQAILYASVFGVSTVLAVNFRFAEERLGLVWRNWLTRRLVAGYMEHGAPYRLREGARIDNPDQRITDDVRAFTTGTLSFVLMLLNGSFTIVAFAGVLWSISPRLFAVAVGYAAVGSVLTVGLGRPLIWLNYAQSDREASFRADLVHLRENAESVAMLRREGRLRMRLLHRIRELTGNANRIISVSRNLSYFTTGYNYLLQIIPALIVGPLFMRGDVEFGVITQSAMAFTHLIGAFSLIVTEFQRISSFTAVFARLATLTEALEETAASSSPIEIREEEGARIAWEGLTLCSPHDGELLIDDLSAEIPHGTRVLVVGPNEPAKIALFRATAGLWDSGEGRIIRPASSGILFVPERPYLPPGTMREALVRTGREHGLPDAKIRAVLRSLGLEAVLERAGGLDVEREWDDLLSLGEQQLVVVARLLLATPSFAVLDRIDTTLGAAQTARVFDRLVEASITVISFGVADGRRDAYDALLELRDGGSWSFAPRRRERVAP